MIMRSMDRLKAQGTPKLSWTEKENRKCIRTPYVRPVNYTVIGQFRHVSSEVTLQGTILDIGDGGVRIRTDAQPYREEMMIRAWIPMPQPPLSIPVIAEVRWVRDEKQQVYDIGLQFVC